MAGLTLVWCVVIHPIVMTDGAHVPRPCVDAGHGLAVADRATLVGRGRMNLLHSLAVAREALGLGLVMGAMAHRTQLGVGASGCLSMARGTAEPDLHVPAVREVSGRGADDPSGGAGRPVVAAFASHGTTVVAIGADRW